MLKKIKLNFGTKNGSDNLEFDLGSVTIFVGPNNSGKSLLLREIEQYCQNGKQATFKILNEVELDSLNDETLNENINSMNVLVKPNESLEVGQSMYGRFNSTKGFVKFKHNVSNLIIWKNTPTHSKPFFQYYVSMYVSRFGGKERFALVQNKDNADLKLDPQNSLNALFQDNHKRLKVRNLIFEAFQKYFVIDPTSMKQLEIRLSEVSPVSEAVERGWTDEAVLFHSKATSISEASDGVQAFTGLAMTVIAGEEKIMLIDEPEAFLHPSLANLLGRKLSEEMTSREGNLIVSTHSPFFVMGCLQSGMPMNIVRLTYDQNIASARLLKSEKVVELFKNPLLRSSGVIQALFHSSVIVSESDADRAFYNEINERVVNSSCNYGITNTLFLNAQNKQTVWNIVDPLRKMGIPAVGIVDVDFIKCGGAEFTKALKAVGIPDALHTSFSDMRNKTHNFLLATTKCMKRDGGIHLLKDGELAVAQKLISDLAEYGLFIIPGGELESWLKQLGCSSHGPGWLIQIFEKIGTDPLDPNYLKPATGDVWAFMEGIHAWISNTNRKGT